MRIRNIGLLSTTVPRLLCRCDAQLSKATPPTANSATNRPRAGRGADKCPFETARADETQRFVRSLTSHSALYAASGLVDVQAASSGELSSYSVVFDRPGQAWRGHAHR